jgi:hypothetical protein
MNPNVVERRLNQRSSWFSWYEEIVERALGRAMRQQEIDVDETQFMLAA